MKGRMKASAVLAVVLAAVFVSGPSAAGAVDFQAGLGFIVGSPQGELRNNIDGNGYGLGIEGFVGPDRSPFSVGLNFGFMNYGHDERTEALSTTIPDLKVRVRNDNNIVHGNLVLRFQPVRTGWLRPYADGLVGFKYLYTSTSIENENSWGGEEIASSTNFDDGALSYGVGGGLLFRVHTFDNFAETDRRADLFVDFKVRYLHGGDAEYLRKGSIRTSEGRVEYDVRKSETDMLVFHLGVSFGF